MKNHARSLRRALWLVVVALSLAGPGSASAHILHGEAVGFGRGFAHPVSGWDHVIAMIAVGIWGAQLGRPAIWLLPVTFPVVMAFGGFLGLVGFHLPGIEIGIAASAILLGTMVLGAFRPPLAVAAIMVGFFGLCHGYAHGAELPAGENALLYSMGFVIATGLLHGLGVSMGLIHEWPAGRMVLRGVGAAIALGGGYFLYQAFQPEPAEPASHAVVRPAIHAAA